MQIYCKKKAWEAITPKTSPKSAPQMISSSVCPDKFKYVPVIDTLSEYRGFAVGQIPLKDFLFLVLIGHVVHPQYCHCDTKCKYWRKTKAIPDKI